MKIDGHFAAGGSRRAETQATNGETAREALGRQQPASAVRMLITARKRIEMQMVACDACWRRSGTERCGPTFWAKQGNRPNSQEAEAGESRPR